MKTQLSSEQRRLCSRSGHGEKRPEATHTRVVRGLIPGSRPQRHYLAFYPECAEHAAEPIPDKLGVTESVRVIKK